MLTPNNKEVTIAINSEPAIAYSENDLTTAYLHCNHYPIQSYEWYMKVKATRGAADRSEHEFVRGEEYFIKYDKETNEVSDPELSEKWL